MLISINFTFNFLSLSLSLYAVTDMEGFNSHLNMEQMNKALISLNEMYNKAAAEGHPSPNGKKFLFYFYFYTKREL
jgi:hypothetical protein